MPLLVKGLLGDRPGAPWSKGVNASPQQPAGLDLFTIGHSNHPIERFFGADLFDDRAAQLAAAYRRRARAVAFRSR